MIHAFRHLYCRVVKGRNEQTSLWGNTCKRQISLIRGPRGRAVTKNAVVNIALTKLLLLNIVAINHPIKIKVGCNNPVLDNNRTTVLGLKLLSAHISKNKAFLPYLRKILMKITQILLNSKKDYCLELN